MTDEQVAILNKLADAHKKLKAMFSQAPITNPPPPGDGSAIPAAEFIATPTVGTTAQLFTFTDQSSQSPTSWAWNFGDSNTSTSQNPTHTYAGAGTYTVTLTATNAHGASTAVKTGYIVVAAVPPPPPPPPPQANFTAAPTSGAAPLPVTFTDTSTGTPTGWAYDIDNSGSTDYSTQNPVHTYTSAGTYSVKQTVTNANGSTSLTRSNLIVVSAPPPPPPDPGPLAKIKLAALQHLPLSGLANAADRAILARYDMVQNSIYPGAGATVVTWLNALRTANPDIYLTQYVQQAESRGRGIASIVRVGTSGSRYRFTLDTGSYGSAGAVMAVRCSARASANANLTILSVGTGFFEANVSGVMSNESPSTAICLLANDAHLGRFLVASDGNRWLRNTSGRVIDSGVDTSQRAINITQCTVADSLARYYPQAKADYDKQHLIDPYTPTILNTATGRGWDAIWIDNWNYRPRTDSGVWGTVVGASPAGGSAIARTNSGLQTRYRNALDDYEDRHRSNNAGIKIIGNADRVGGTSTVSLNWPEWAVGTLDGAFWENVFDSATSIGYFFNNNWATLQNTFRERRARVGNPFWDIFQCQGNGATTAAQHRDYRGMVISMAAYMMQGTSQSNMGFFSWGPQKHDVTNDTGAPGNQDHSWHDEWNWECGEPIEGEQTAARGLSNRPSVWMRYFEGGVVVANSSTTATVTITPSDLQTPAGVAAPHDAGTTYRRLTRVEGPANPNNTGVAFTSGSITLGPATSTGTTPPAAVILQAVFA